MPVRDQREARCPRAKHGIDGNAERDDEEGRRNRAEHAHGPKPGALERDEDHEARKRDDDSTGVQVAQESGG